MYQNNNYQQFGRQSMQPQLNNVQQFIQRVKSCGNPQQMLESIVQNNPKLGIMQLLQQNGGNAKQAFYALAQERGVDPDDILNMLN